MGHMYNGFTVSDSAKIQNGIAEASKAVAAAWKEVQNIYKAKAGTPAYTTWFGTTSQNRLKHVFEVFSALDFAMNSCSIKFNRDVTDNDYAAAYPPTEGWNMKNVKKIIASQGFKVDIGNAYFGGGGGDELEQLGAMIQGGEHAHTQAIIHEISHIVGFTHDVGKDHVNGRPLNLESNTDEYYGKVSARILASRYPDFAIYNADNYGFYCCQVYYGEA